MQRALRHAVTVCLTLSASSAMAQNNAVVELDGGTRGVYCINPDGTKPPFQPPFPRCSGFLVQGQLNELRVHKRRFLTNYTFFIDKITKVQAFPIESLEEAGNLPPVPGGPGAPVTKGVAPKGLATNGTLPLRSAHELVGELLDPASSSNVVNEITSDWLVVKREAATLLNDALGANATWVKILGSAPPRPCDSAYWAPTLKSASACLEDTYGYHTNPPFGASGPFTDEGGFRRLVAKDNAAVAMVNLLAGVLGRQTPVLASYVSAFEGDLAVLRADLNAFLGNLSAVDDAVTLVGSMTEEMTKAQIKAKLAQRLSGTTKPILDDAELNQLTEIYYRFARATPTTAGNSAVAITRAAVGRLRGAVVTELARQLTDATTLAATLPAPPPLPPSVNCFSTTANAIVIACLSDQLSTIHGYLLERTSRHLSVELPSGIEETNVAQSRLLTRVNDIYEHSEVSSPLEKAIDLGDHSGNLRVYFTIYETELFPRFTIPSTTASGGPVVAASPVAAAPAAGAVALGGTTTASGQPQGTPVTSGVLEVHDRYRATMVGAFAFSSVKETSIATTSITSGSTTDGMACSADPQCTQVTASAGPAHSSVILGVSYHPWSYDTFPGAQSWKKDALGALKHGFGVFAGLSLQRWNDYYVGAALQIGGLEFIGGVNFVRQDTLAAGFDSGNIYSGAPTFTGPQQWSHGGYFGLGLNLTIFRKAFGAVTGLGSKATTSGG
jgi:hypothetical protein